MRLIDANDFAEQYGNYYAEEGPENGFIGTVGELIAKQPTIEPEVQLAHWIPCKRGKWRCSCCGNEIYCTSADDLQRNHEFCGHCGAEMKDKCNMRTLIEEAIL